MVIKNIDATLIAKKFLVRGYNINPNAVRILCNLSPEQIDSIIAEVCRIARGKFIISEEDVRRALAGIKTYEREIKKPEAPKPKIKEHAEIKVLKDVTGSSFCEGKVEDFVVYFNSRFEKLSRILRNRLRSVPISNLGRFRGERVEVVGMVSNVREINDGYLLELEDKTGRITCIATGKLKETAQELLGDEVVGVSGTLRGRSIIADRIIFPDVPLNGRKLKKDFSIVFISDTHFGSKEFLEREWKVFIKWLNGEIGNEKMRDSASKVKYIVVAGDIVDGVGIYPGQEEDLIITDIYEQY
ncbi:DNA polymerase II small subunit, partial [Archaeoglobales archaeon]